MSKKCQDLSKTVEMCHDMSRCIDLLNPKLIEISWMQGCQLILLNLDTNFYLYNNNFPKCGLWSDFPISYFRLYDDLSDDL